MSDNRTTNAAVTDAMLDAALMRRALENALRHRSDVPDLKRIANEAFDLPPDYWEPPRS